MKISNEKLVSITYSIYENNVLLESTDVPVSFIFGKETNLIPIVENSLKGKVKGDHISLEVRPSLGFGEYDNKLVFSDDIENVPEEYRKLGMEIDFASESGQKRKFKDTKIDNNRITFDGNHPFSGKHLVYKIKIVDVINAKQYEN